MGPRDRLSGNLQAPSIDPSFPPIRLWTESSLLAPLSPSRLSPSISSAPVSARSVSSPPRPPLLLVAGRREGSLRAAPSDLGVVSGDGRRRILPFGPPPTLVLSR